MDTSAPHGAPDDEPDGPRGSRALAHNLLLEAVDCVSQASELTDNDVSTSLRRAAAELAVIADRLSSSTD